MDKIVITIARYYGSGGKTIGEMLGEELGIPFYNREILRMASDDSGISEALFAQADEKLKKTTLFRVAHKAYDGTVIPPESKDFLSNQNLFNYQAKVIKGLAEEGACVIIGRCGDYVLRDNPNRVAVFVHAPADYCRQMAIERGAQSTRDVDRFIAQTDKARAEYYHYYTGQEWSNAKNYDLCLNSKVLGFDGCAEAIKAYINIRFGSDWREKE